MLHGIYEEGYSMTGNQNVTGIIAKIALNELGRIYKSPFVIIIYIIFIVNIFLTGYGSQFFDQAWVSQPGEGDVFIRIAIGDVFYYTSLFCAITAMFFGVLSVLDDKNSHALNVLLSKPVYRRDVLIGKFVGINLFSIILITVTLAGSLLMHMLFNGIPGLMDELLIRAVSLIAILSMECALVSGITMLFGLACKNLLEGVAVTITFLFVEWEGSLTRYLGSFKILSPHELYFTIFHVDKAKLLIDTTVPYYVWLSAAAPYILFMLLEIIAIVALNCIIFSRSDEV